MVTIQSGTIRPFGSDVITPSKEVKPLVDGRVTFENVQPGLTVVRLNYGESVSTLRVTVPSVDEVLLSELLEGSSPETQSELQTFRSEVLAQMAKALETARTVSTAAEQAVAAANEAKAAAAAAANGGTSFSLAVGTVGRGAEPSAEIVPGDSEGQFKLNLIFPETGGTVQAGPGVLVAENEPPAATQSVLEGTICLVTETDQVYVLEAGRWELKGTLGGGTSAPATVTDEAVANILNSGQLTREALTRFTGTGPSQKTALEIYFPNALDRHVAALSYPWNTSDYNETSMWHMVWRQLALTPFAVVNPSSGPSDKREPDFVRAMERLKRFGKAACVYVRTVTDLNLRTMRPLDDIKASIQKYFDQYGDLVTGVFIDEAPNGWTEVGKAQIPIYKELYEWIKSTYGQHILVIANPGSPTTEELLGCADVLMTYESNAEGYLSAESNKVPDWYKNELPIRFYHTVYGIKDRQQAIQVLEEATKSNVATVYLTDDTFSGVIGSESQSNNPWDAIPSRWLEELQAAWARFMPLNATAAGTVLDVKVVASQEEASRLPVGTLYVIAGGGSGSQNNAYVPFEVVGTAGANENTQSFSFNIDGAQPDDVVLVGVAAKGTSGLTIAPPSDWETDIEGYWTGTLQSWVFRGTYGTIREFTANMPAELAWAAIAVRGAGNVITDKIFTRGEGHGDATTNFAASGYGYANGDQIVFTFERTTANETQAEIELSGSWKMEKFVEQGANIQTVGVLTTTEPWEREARISYPNPQASNGAAVMVIANGSR